MSLGAGAARQNVGGLEVSVRIGGFRGNLEASNELLARL